MKNLTLTQIAKICGEALRNGDGREDEEITCAVVDSRKIEKGGLFFAAQGEKVDGHKFIAQVFEAGALLVICTKTPEEVEKEHGIPADKWGSYIVVKDSYEALKKVAKAYREGLSIPVVGITGSVGKTSTKEFIAGVLAEKYRVLKTEGNFNNEIGLPLTLLRIREEHEAAVVEMGISDFGEMSRLGDMARPDICVITNIGQCHLENLHDREGVKKAKTEIFDYMQKDGEVCLCGDDDLLAQIKEVNGKRVHFFGLNETVCGGSKDLAGDRAESYVTSVINKGLLGSDAQLHIGEKSFPVTVNLPGIHMVKNACAAALVGKLLGLRDDEIASGISHVKPVDGRSNLIALADKLILDDCYNANPVSMKAAIDLLQNAQGRTAAVLGDMFELGDNSSALHASVGEYAAASGVNLLIFAGESAKYMYDAALPVKQEGQQIFYFADREELLANLGKILKKGDAVLVKASHGMGFAKVVEELKNTPPCS